MLFYQLIASLCLSLHNLIKKELTSDFVTQLPLVSKVLLA